MKMNLNQVISVWITGRSRVTEQLYTKFINDMDAHSRRLFGKSILEVSPVELVEVMRAKTWKNKPSSRSVQTWIVKGFFKLCQKLKVRPDNPAEHLTPPKFEDTIADRILTHEEVEKVLGAAINDRDRVLIHMLYGAGLRVSEALSVKKKDLLEQNIRVFGKGGKTRYVRISGQLETLLAGWAAALNPEDYLFPGYHKGKPLHRGTAGMIVKKLAIKAGLPKASPHFFRHAHATTALKNGASLTVVQRSLGHVDVRTTLRYSHVMPGEGAANFLPSLKG